MEKYDIEFVRGDTFSFDFMLEGVENIDKAFFSCKENPEDLEYKFQKELDKGIKKVEKGRYQVKISPVDTEKLEARSIYYYDLQIELNGDILTPISGKLKLHQDITRNEVI